ncbi:MAG: type II secretion system protein GspE [Firmicutes bacterium]|nr:type II secretion system protein GspE [Bacillota bacterium]
MKQGQNLLGDCLINEGVLTRERLEEALNAQKKDKGKQGLLGETLVELGYCSEDDLARVIAKRAGVPLVSLESFTVDPAAVATMSVDSARRYRALPIAYESDKLVMAMRHPTDLMAIDDLRILTGHDITPVFAPDSELEAAIDRYLLTDMEFEQVEEDELQADDITSGSEGTGDNPAVQLANMILSQAVNAKASDIHIEPYDKNVRIRFRIDGVLHDMLTPPRRMHGSLISRIKVMANMDIAERRKPQDGRMSLKIEGRTVDFRVASLPTSFGERLTLRLLDRTGSVISLEELGISSEVLDRFRQVIKLPYGMILVTGPTGSGKTTTLYAAMEVVDRSEKNVITVEDPVEYRMEGISQVQINTKAGLTFTAGLRSILRSDPDIMMVGEIRDRETARLAVESAMTGHLVLSSLHTNDAAGTISRLTEMEIEPFLTASSLKCVVSQRLVRVLCNHCKEPYEICRSDVENVNDFPWEQDTGSMTLYRPAGCMRCSNTGYRGRMGVYELLFASEAVQQLTLDRKPAGEIKKAAVAEGMITMWQDGMKKVKKGTTSLEEVLRVVV